jgi:asparagine synthase (glutamine-hydrolysing)
MCGIATFVNGKASAVELDRTLDRMLPGIVSRGPDGTGRNVADGVALLHTRLAIIDLVTGDQPIWNEAGTVACIFNGEIYNYRELRDSLLERGHVFKTQSDTEVLVHLYEEHGGALVQHIHGMYAFVIHDRARRRVIAARDRLGIKPLYQARFNGGFALASSIGSLLAGGADRSPDPTAIAQYMRFHKVPEPRTAFGSISAFPPGHVATIDIDSAAVTMSRFYRARVAVTAESPHDAEARARFAFEQAIATHMVADVEVAAFLSGGIDSSLVVAQAQRSANRPLRTFCISFPDHASHDEAAFARRVAASLGTRHETIEVRPAPTELVRAAISAAHQPFAVASMLPLLLLCEQASKNVKVVLTGDGGDEVGFGYPWYRWMHATQRIRLSRVPRALSTSLLGVERHAANLRPLRRAAKFARGVLAGGAGASDAWRYDLSHEDSLALLAPELRAMVVDAPTPTESVWDTTQSEVEALRDADVRVLLRDEMLPKLDRAGMAHGLEGRVPLLDDDFVEAMLAIPWEQHVAGGVSKSILRRWARELAPGVEAERPKHGFDVPIGAWLADSLRDDVQRLLLKDGRPRLLDGLAVRTLWDRARKGVPGAAHDVFAALMLALWHEESERA